MQTRSPSGSCLGAPAAFPPSLVTYVKESEAPDVPIYDLGTESCLVWRQRSGEPCPLPPSRALASPCGEFSRVHNAGAGYSLSSPDFLLRACKPGEVQSFLSEPRRSLGMLSGRARLRWPEAALGSRARVGGRLGSASPSAG